MQEGLSLGATGATPLPVVSNPNAGRRTASDFARPLAGVATPPPVRRTLSESEDPRHGQRTRPDARSHAPDGRGTIPDVVSEFSGETDPGSASATAASGFLAQHIAQEVLAAGGQATPRFANAALYRTPGDSRVTVLGPQVSLDITV
ncbi:MAG: hypothetical protein WCF16_06560 [Alphaproteobacteria bacterium]